MTWGWDWEHQSYSREGSGFLGYEDCISPIISAGSPETHWPTGTGSSIQERKNLTFGAKNWCEHPDSSKIFDPLDFPWCFFLTNLRGFTAMLVGEGVLLVLGNPLSRWISWDFLLARILGKPKHCWKTKRDPCNILSTWKVTDPWDRYFYLYKYHKTQPFT